MPITGLDRMPGSGLARGTLFDKELNVTEIDVPDLTVRSSLILEKSGENAYNIIWTSPSGQARNLSIPAMTAADTFVFLAQTQTLTNKTLTSPAINTPTISAGTITGITDLDMAVGNRTIFDTIAANTLTMGASDTTVSIPGNLTVSGTTTTVNTTTLNVADNLFLLNSDFTGSATQDSGIVIERGDDTNVALVWDESADEFIMVTTNSTGSGNDIVVAAYANLQIANLAVAQIDAFTLSGKLTAGSNEIEGSAFDIDGGDVSAITVSGGLTWNSAQNLNSQALTNVNIDSGDISAATISGGLTWSANQDLNNVNLTNVDIDSGDISAATISGGLTWSANQDLNNVNLTNVDIDSGDVSAITVSGGLTWSSAQNLNSQALTNVNIDSGDISAATISGGLTWSSAQNLNSQALTNVNIDSGDISAATISGDLTWSSNQDMGSINLQTGGKLVIDTDSGATINSSGGGVDGAGSITLGAGQDAGLYVNSDDLYIENKTTDKDIIFRGNDDSTFKTIMTIDSSTATVVIPTVDINGGDVSGVTVSGGLTWSAAQNLNSQALTNVNIDSGDISAATISGGLTWNAAQDLNNVALTNVDINSGTVDAITSLTVANNVDVGNYTIRANNFLADSHTATRVFFAGTDGVLTSDSDLTFATDTLTATKIGAFTAAGAIDFDNQNMTNVDIDSGDIASGVTINKSPTITLTGAVTASATAMSNLGNVSISTTMSASQTNITAVGALDAGSITSNFGTINNGSSSITTTGTVTTGALVVGGDISTAAAQDWDLIDNNASALSFDAAGKSGILEIVTTNGSEKVAMSGDLTVAGNMTVTGTTTQVNTVTMNAQNAVIFEGATADDHETTLTIVDPTADRTVYMPNQSGYLPVLAAVSTTQVSSTPEELNILDGVTASTAELNIMDGVTSTTAELNLIDGSTANTVVNSKAVIYGSSGELAGTLSTAAQTNVTSLGTLTALTVDDVVINGKVVTMTGSSGDTATLTVGTNGTLDIVTTDTAAAAANIQITADGTAELAGTTVTLDSGGGITLDADSGTITFADGGSSLGTITSSGYSGNAATATALATGRTIGMTGDVVWTSASFDGSGNVTGAATIQSDAVETAMLNDNIISGQTEITSGLADADELLYSDAGTLKRVGMDTLKTYFSAVAGNTSLVTVGTIATGTWQGTAINDTYIGTIDNANKVALTALDIDGGTDINAAIVDADLLIIDDGAGGTNKKTAASRLPTYIFSKVGTDVTIASNGAATIANSAVTVAKMANLADMKVLGNVSGGAAAPAAVSILDEDDLSTDSATALATQQSIKAYVDAQVDTEDTLAELDDTNITSPADASLLFYDTATSKWIDNVVSGDVTIADTGVAAISSGVIVNADISGSAAIANSKLANSTITVSDGSNTTAVALGGTVTFAATSNETTVAESSGTVTIGLPDDVTIGGDLIVTGDLTVSGDNTIVNTATLSVEDILVELSKGQTTGTNTDAVDVGIYAPYRVSGGTRYRGMFYDVSATRWKFFNRTGNSDEAPGTNNIVNTTSGIALGDLEVGSIYGTIATVAQTNITSVGTLSSLVIADAGTIGSASDTDAIAISSGGVVTMNQIPVFSAGINVSGGTIAGTIATATQNSITTMTGLVTTAATTVGALASGSIASGFGTISTGNSITTSAAISGGSLAVDDVRINGATIGHVNDTDLMTVADGLVTVAGEISVTTLDIGGTNVTATATEINLIDGGTARGTTSVASGDGILINDGGTMRMTDVDTVSTYFASHSVGGSNIVTTGALNSGSITSGFGTINNGSSAISTTGTITYGSLSDGTISVTAWADEDNMSSDSATLVPTQQSVKAYVDSQVSGTGTMSNFILEDGDGTEVTISNAKEVKFVEGGGIDINWTDTDNGTDADPYDLTFTVNAAQPTITSLGTLTTLTVDDITINGSTISDAGALTIDGGTGITLQTASSGGITLAEVVYFNGGTAANPSITKNGDTNTGILFPSADNFAVTTGGVQRMLVNSSGVFAQNVNDSYGAIGLANPTTDSTHIQWVLSKRNGNEDFWIYGYDGSSYKNFIKMDWSTGGTHLDAGGLTVDGVVDITDTTDSSDDSGDTGALRVEGGASIAKKLYIGTDLDVDGTTNLDVVDIDGAVDMASTLTGGGGDLIWDTDTLIVDVSADKVGIGITDPDTTLHVHASSAGSIAAANSQFTVESSGNTGVTLLSGNTSNGAIFFGDDGSNASGRIYYDHGTGTGSTANRFVFFTNGGERMSILADGSVGMMDSGGYQGGATYDYARLAVKRVDDTVLALDRVDGSGSTSNGGMVRFYSGGSVIGLIDNQSGTLTYGTFTGSHLALTEESIEFGMLVSMTGTNSRWHDEADAELIYGVVKSTTANDPKLLGTYLGVSEPKDAASVDNPHLIACVGNGPMWLVDKGANIAVGDYLISSDVAGHAMKDDGTNAVSYVIGRATEVIDWSTVTDTVGSTKHKKITVTYESFKNFEGKINSLEARIAALEN